MMKSISNKLQRRNFMKSKIELNYYLLLFVLYVITVAFALMDNKFFIPTLLSIIDEFVRLTFKPRISEKQDRQLSFIALIVFSIWAITWKRSG